MRTVHTIFFFRAGSSVTLVKNTADIENEVEAFYENLYKKRDSQDCEITNLVRTIPKLVHEEQQSLDGKITIEEAGYALNKMENGKSPGSDGFTVEFF